MRVRRSSIRGVEESNRDATRVGGCRGMDTLAGGRGREGMRATTECEEMREKLTETIQARKEGHATYKGQRRRRRRIPGYQGLCNDMVNKGGDVGRGTEKKTFTYMRFCLLLRPRLYTDDSGFTRQNTAAAATANTAIPNTWDAFQVLK